jgi:hypothetical protein
VRHEQCGSLSLSVSLLRPSAKTSITRPERKEPHPEDQHRPKGLFPSIAFVHLPQPPRVGCELEASRQNMKDPEFLRLDANDGAVEESEHIDTPDADELPLNDCALSVNIAVGSPREGSIATSSITVGVGGVYRAPGPRELGQGAKGV